MKTNHFFIFMAALVLISCESRPVTTNRNVFESYKYNTYNPEDTIGNEPYCQMLRIDSARVELLSDPKMSMLPSTRTKERSGENDLFVLGNNKGADSSLYEVAEAKWQELMRLCSKKQYEDVLNLYGKAETEISLALSTSTNKFYLDFYVIVDLLFDQMDEYEASECFIKYLEYDKWLSECEILFSTLDGGNGFVPPQYAFLIEVLRDVYLIQYEWEKAEALIEPYRNALYLLSDDTLANERMAAAFKLFLYIELDDGVEIKKTFEEYRAFLIQYAKNTHRNLDEQIEELDSLAIELRIQQNNYFTTSLK